MRLRLTPYYMQLSHLGKGREIREDLCNSKYIEDRRRAMLKWNYEGEVIEQALSQQDAQEFTFSAQCKRDAFDKFIQQCIFLSEYPALDRVQKMMPHEIAYFQLTRIFSNVPRKLMGQPAVSLLRRARSESAAIGRFERCRDTPSMSFEVPSLVRVCPSLPAVLQDNVGPGKNLNEITP